MLRKNYNKVNFGLNVGPEKNCKAMACILFGVSSVRSLGKKEKLGQRCSG